MKNKLLKFAGLASLMAVAGSANALVALDAWQIDTANAPATTLSGTTTNIGHLNLSGGVATVEQEIGVGGTPFAGARFEEFGVIYTISYTPENVPGLGDNGAPALFAPAGQSFRLEFSDLEGTVDSYNVGTGEIEYTFTPGAGTINLLSAGNDILASFEMGNKSGGDLGDFNSIGDQSQGQSTISAEVISGVTDIFRDSAGLTLDDLITNGDLFALVVTTNKISAPGFIGPAAACSFDAGAFCVSGDVTSDGSLDLLRVPEPGILSLLGLGLVGMGRSFRKARKA